MSNLRIDGDRLWDSIHETAVFGGTPDGGVKRLTLSQEDRTVREWFKSQCEELGCRVSVDEVGNMFALRPGLDDGLLPVAIGSHLDTQPTGGKFDGILGVLSGLEAIRVLHDADYHTRHPLMLVNWTNEEGARFAPAMLGSGVHAGVFDRSFADSRTDADGVTFAQAIEAIGYRGSTPLGQTRFAAMFELHIEQGPVLEREAIEIGVVTGVQAMRWYDLVIIGREAHAGSTPMDMRQDALVDAAQIILAAQDVARRHGGLATTGTISIAEPSRNVIPGHVTLSLDLRHEQDAELDAMEREITSVIAERCQSARATLTPIWKSPAVRFDAACLEAIKKGASAAGASTRNIVSGAGHDSVYVSRIAPTAMIFIPCRDGLSHNPAESASREHCTLGAQTLLNAVLFHDQTPDEGRR
ncbi:M20 family metallo-hydrolase [Agrobacterium rhizogenes]|uniref:M20 family metallo-hydrolase n=1 Tax=Rhizobium rhizogenes TaxID=359 RepID=UPI0015723556|nr:M20 family metallo-hydrolase [Rhizobium rhizogenes]NTG51701.1 M20 family metallo-hydrolase [Rhizobium rhizogenes]